MRSSDWLGTANDVMKLSRADLPYAVALGAARRDHGGRNHDLRPSCRHPRFRHGGIGGVHQGVESTMDISADLDELARTPIAVICAGAKAILDLPRTLEYLETRGVPVIGYRTDRFPAFWSRTSELSVPLRLDSPDAMADLIRTKEALGLEGGVLVANPVPSADEIPADEMKAFIDGAVAEAKARGVIGKAVTRSCCLNLREDGGGSLATNIAW